MRTVRISCLLCLGLVASSALRAQKADFAVSFAAARSLQAANSQNFWLQGGSAELGVNAWKGLGIAANVTGMQTGAIGTSSIPLSLVTTTFGPRYRWHAHDRLSIYGEGLLGEANGFRSLFPHTGGAVRSANALAAQVGGGVDLTLGHRFAVRLLQASWLRTQLPNATNNVQNTLVVGAGIVLRSKH